MNAYASRDTKVLVKHSYTITEIVLYPEYYNENVVHKNLERPSKLRLKTHGMLRGVEGSKDKHHIYNETKETLLLVVVLLLWWPRVHLVSRVKLISTCF